MLLRRSEVSSDIYRTSQLDSVIVYVEEQVQHMACSRNLAAVYAEEKGSHKCRLIDQSIF